MTHAARLGDIKPVERWVKTNSADANKKAGNEAGF
jgi:hypothetical protein